MFNNVKIVLSTFDAKERVTFYDISLALFINKEYKRQTGGWSEPRRHCRSRGRCRCFHRHRP